MPIFGEGLILNQGVAKAAGRMQGPHLQPSFPLGPQTGTVLEVFEAANEVLEIAAPNLGCRCWV